MSQKCSEVSPHPVIKCRICSGISSGVHYGVVSCEGCKAFYKRCMELKLMYQCFFGGKCSVSVRRGRCKACRFNKCVAMGMSFQATKMGRIPKLEKAKQLAALMDDAANEAPTYRTGFTLPTDLSDEAAVGGSADRSTEQQLRLSPRQAIQPTESRNLIDTVDAPPRCGAGLHEDNHDRVLETLEMAELKTDIVQDSSAGSTVNASSLRFTAFLENYLALTEQKNANLRGTAMAVTDAVTVVYWDQIQTWTAFMTKAIGAREIPVQPRIDLGRFPQLARDIYVDDQRRMTGFARSIPGFADLSLNDQSAIISEKYTLVWMFHHAPYTTAGEVFYLAGLDDFHYGRYWLDLTLDRNFIKEVLMFMDGLNDLQLTLTESYVLMAVGVFRPDTTNANNKSMLGAMQAHYMDVLLYLLKSRLSPSALSRTLKFLKETIKKMPCIHGIATQYVNMLDLDKLPFRPSHGQDFASLMGHVCKDCDHICRHAIS